MGSISVTMTRAPKPRRLGALLGDALEEVLDHLFFVTSPGAVDPVVAFFELVTFMEEKRGIPAVVDHQLRAEFTGVGDRAEGTLPIFFEGLTLPGEHRHTG